MINTEMVNVQTRMPLATKNAAEDIFNKMGMSLSDGIRIYVSQVINERALPFQPSAGNIPNDETIAAMNETGRKTTLAELRSEMGL